MRNCVEEFWICMPVRLGLTEKKNAGIHEDAFFVGRTMFMHIHGHTHCDIRLAKADQERVLAEGQSVKTVWAKRGIV